MEDPFGEVDTVGDTLHVGSPLILGFPVNDALKVSTAVELIVTVIVPEDEELSVGGTEGVPVGIEGFGVPEVEAVVVAVIDVRDVVVTDAVSDGGGDPDTVPVTEGYDDVTGDAVPETL